MRAKIVVNESQFRAGHAIAESMGRDEAAREAASSTPVSDFESASVTSEAALGVATEPHATPSNNLALALEANEQIRMLFKSKSHRGDPCRHLCGVATPTELAETACEEHDRPQTLLPIVDCKVDLLEDELADVPPLTPLPHRRDAGLATVAISSPCAATRPSACPSCSTCTRAIVRGTTRSAK